MPDNKEQLNARTDVLGLVAIAKALQICCPTESRDHILRRLRGEVSCGEGVTMEDQLMEAIWALANQERL